MYQRTQNKLAAGVNLRIQRHRPGTHVQRQERLDASALIEERKFILPLSFCSIGHLYLDWVMPALTEEGESLYKEY